MKKSLFICFIGIILAQSGFCQESAIPHSSSYKVVDKMEEMPVGFIVKRDKDFWEIHFLQTKKEMIVDAVAVLHAERPIKKISDSYTTLFLVQNYDSLSLDFFMSFSKKMMEGEYLYLKFQTKKTEHETVSYVVRIDKL